MALEYETGFETTYCYVCGTVATCPDPRECEDEANRAIFEEQAAILAEAPIPCYICDVKPATACVGSDYVGTVAVCGPCATLIS